MPNHPITHHPQEEQVMPLKLIAGVSKKLGLPGYSSVGAICHLELELDSGLIQEAPETFRAQVREVYALCAESVDEELARYQALRNQAGSAAEMPADGFAVANRGPAHSNGHAQGDPHGNGHTNSFCPSPSPGNGRGRSRLSARQMEYAQTLAGRLGMDAEQLDTVCRQRYEKPLEELTGGEASGLIRALQEMQGWQGPGVADRPDDE
jgi:hypothetical protein